MNSVNLGVFRWTPKRKKAAKLLSSGLYDYKSAAMETGITEDTLLAWRQQPVFFATFQLLPFMTIYSQVESNFLTSASLSSNDNQDALWKTPQAEV